MRRPSLVLLLSCLFMANASSCGPSEEPDHGALGPQAGAGGGGTPASSSAGNSSAGGPSASGGSGGANTSVNAGAAPATGGAADAPETGGSGGEPTEEGGTGGVAEVGGAAGSGGMTASGGADTNTGGAVDMPPPVDQDALPDLTVHLAGDSTVTSELVASNPGQEGWGLEFGQYFISKVQVNNRAIGGASVKSFEGGSRWSSIRSAMKPGDYVMMGFGANDSSTGDRHVAVPEFTAILSGMIDEVKAAQATPILFTPSALQVWVNGEPSNERLQPYCDAILSLGPMKDVLVADLNARGMEHLREIGQAGTTDFYYEGDKAHFTQKGATETAKFVTEELQRIQSPLSDYLKREE